jgi:acetoacetate decarboxylase
MTEPALVSPGELANWPSLRFVYRTDADKLAEVVPPGLEPMDPEVHVHVYQVPIMGEPEYGVVIKVPARFNGIDGYYWVGTGIDQEQAVFISQELNGQPKFPCRVRYYRLGDKIVARCSHQDYTFLEFAGEVGEDVTDEYPRQYSENEWWIKSVRAVGGAEKSYDFPPQVVRVTSTSTVEYRLAVDGELVLRDSPWDPIAEQLPIREQLSVVLHKSQMDFASRSVSIEGPLDPIAYWPYADTIGGSRWPGMAGGPRRRL